MWSWQTLSIHGIVCKSHQTAQRGQETDCEPVLMEENKLTAVERDESMDENVLGENEDPDENEEEENESESEDWNSVDWNESESEDKDFDEEVGSVLLYVPNYLLYNSRLPLTTPKQ